MTALASERRLREERWTYKQFGLATGKKAYQGGLAVYDQSAAACIPAEEQTDLFALGLFAETVDNTTGATAALVNVRLKREIRLLWFANDTANPVTSNDIGKDVFAVDDQTVSIDSATSTRSILGKAWAIDATKGVAVEMT